MDGLIHLAGENILQWPWTRTVKKRILESRSIGTAFLARTLSELKEPPRMFISASGISYYGNQGANWVDESSLMDRQSFLAQVVQAWEEAVESAPLPQTRKAYLRIGIVMGKESRIIQQVKPLFALGLGARLWPANPYISWITLEDTVRAISHVINTDSLSGPVNLVAPNPVTQNEFAEQFAKKLGRPLWLLAPSPLLNLFLGEMGRETVLTSTRVRPTQLLEHGFEFKTPELEF